MQWISSGMHHLVVPPDTNIHELPGDIWYEMDFYVLAYRSMRSIDLVTPQKLKGEELLMRTRGWWTVEPQEVAEVVKKHGRFVVGDGGELMVELPDQEAAEALSIDLTERFGDQVVISP